MAPATPTPTTPPSWRRYLPWVGLLARLILGVTLLTSGYLKVTSLESSAEAVRAFKILPYDLANTFGYLLPVSELSLGALLVLGLFTRWAGLLAGLLMVAFTLGIISVWARGISIDCGCFGGGGVVSASKATATYPWEVARDVGLALCGAWLVWQSSTPFSLDRWLKTEA